ncbi:MAG: AraC family transcriptional regulator [Polyangiales bacterium]
MPSVGTVSALLLRPLASALLAAEADLEAFYQATDLTPEILADAEARVTPSQFCVAWSELVRLTREPTIALRIADVTPPGAFGVVEYVCRSAPTLAEALRRWARYLNLLDDAVEVGLVFEGDRGALRVLAESEAPAPASHELCFALVVAQARKLCAMPFRATSIEFTHRAPVDAAVYRRWFDAPVVFGAKHTQLVMSRSVLDGALVSADENLAAILERYADEELRKKERSAPPITAQVRRILREVLKNDDAQIDYVAKRLGLTARSLQRRLRDEGTSLQSLREEVRRDLAHNYLRGDLSIAEISFLLGFSEPSAFFRAFKRWTGLTPLETRERLRSA